MNFMHPPIPVEVSYMGDHRDPTPKGQSPLRVDWRLIRAAPPSSHQCRRPWWRSILGYSFWEQSCQ